MINTRTDGMGKPGSRTRLQRSWVWGGSLALVALILVGCGPSASMTDTSSEVEGAAPSAAATTPEASLAQHLAATDSAMYGAYWCPHCADQKAMFGEAIDQVPYVECAADGDNAQPDLCSAKGIQAYPTWEIDGQLYPGVKSLEALAELSGYQP